MGLKSGKLIACMLAGAIIITMIPASAKADNTAEVTGYITGANVSFSAGAHSAINETVVLVKEETDVSENETPVVAVPEEEEEEIVVSEYASIAIAQVDAYLNVRAEANAEAEVVGKLYNNNAATVLEELDGWYKITSGNVTGYVNSAYVVVGDEALCKSVSKTVGTITTDALRLRTQPSTDVEVLTLFVRDKQVTVLEATNEEWYKVTDGNYTGYVFAQYLSVETKYSYAESSAEEAERLAIEAEVARREEEARRAEAERWAQIIQQAENKTYNAPSGTSGQAVAEYAVQYVGNPYVWGGESLIYGADCSGFVKAIYAQFGVELPHSSYSLRHVGYAVSESQMLPGDIVCYSGHVGIYIGNGQIVHAANSADGIKISRYNYTTVLAIRRIF